MRGGGADGWQAAPAHRGRFKMCFQVFLASQYFMDSSSSSRSCCCCWCCFSLCEERESSGWADAIWYLKLLSLLVMFVKFFICKQRSQWYLRQSAIWFDAFVFSSFFACFSFRPPHRHRSRRHLNSHSPPPTDDKKSERRLSTATFDNLTICRQCYSSVKVLWL